MRAQPRLSLALLGAALVLLAAAVAAAIGPRPPSPAASPPALPQVDRGLGGNVDLMVLDVAERELLLDQMEEAGFTWLRQRFLWSEIEVAVGDYRWQAADDAVAAASGRGIRLVAVLGGTPAWARPEGQEHAPWAPPARFSDFGDFAAAIAARYGATIDHYQVWDQPNIYPYWGDQYVDARAYTRLLREAAGRIRAADAGATILLAGLAPNVEPGPLNLNEADYLRQVYESGGAPFFDAVAAKAYGFESAADGPAAPGVLSFARAPMLRDVMVAAGDAGKPVWAVEFGWNALPDDWQGQTPPWGSAAPEVQAERTAAAVLRARGDWPWMGPMLLAGLLPPADPSDPATGFAVWDRQGRTTALGAALLPRLADLPRAGSGRHRPDSTAATYSPGWRVSGEGADPGGPGDRVEIRFNGTALDLELRPGPYWAVWYVEVDGRPAPSLPRHDGRAYLVLYDPLGEPRTDAVARGLGPGEHVARIEVQGGWEQWPLAGWVAWQEPAPGMALPAVLAAVGLLALAGAFLLSPWSRPVGTALARVDAMAARAPEWLQAALVFGAGAGFWAVSGLGPSVALGAALGLSLLLWPGWGVALALASLPFFLVGKRLGGAALPMTELLVWPVTGVLLLRWVLGRSGWRVRLTRLDVAVLLLVALAAISVATAANHGVAAHEFRRVIVSGALLFLAVRLLPPAVAGPRVVTGLVLGATAAAGWGLWQYASGTGLIEAGGVDRVRAGYGSPNNLALYLGRAVPVAAALAVFGAAGWRRAIWGAALLLMLGCGVLTRSRGLVLLALPVSLGYLAFAGGYLRGRRGALVLAAAGLALVAMLLATGRLGDLAQGRDPAAGMRLHLWQGTANMLREHPVLGVGLDNFLYEYRTRYVVPPAWQEPDLSHPHNLVLDFWTRLGLGGVLVLAWLGIGGWRASGRALNGAAGRQRAVLLGVRAMLLGALAHGLVDNSFFLVDLSHVALALLAVVAARDGRALLIVGRANDRLDGSVDPAPNLVYDSARRE